MRKVLVLATACLLMTSCVIDKREMVSAEDQYNKEFVKLFGEIDPNHTWSMVENKKVEVNLTKPSNVKVYVKSGKDYHLAADYQDVSGSQQLSFDAPMGCEDVYVTVDGVPYQGAGSRAATATNVVTAMTENGKPVYVPYKFGEIKKFTTDKENSGNPDNPNSNYQAKAFSVSSSKQATFSPGNLQYTQSTNTWSFASAQWEMLETDNVTGGSVESDPEYGDRKEGTALADKVDLFGWSTSTTNFGVSTSEYDNHYSGSFIDWGTNQIGNDAPNTWRTLTYEEWNYLLNNRPNASALCGVAQVNGVNGLIFLPDNWTCPAGVTFKSGFHSEYSVEAYGQYQTFSADQWSKLESAGAVFLPASGFRYGSDVYYVQFHGYYWSATEYGSRSANYLLLTSAEACMYYFYRGYGNSVRLVKDL